MRIHVNVQYIMYSAPLFLCADNSFSAVPHSSKTTITAGTEMKEGTQCFSSPVNELGFLQS